MNEHNIAQVIHLSSEPDGGYAPDAPVKVSYLDGATFLARVTDEEYGAIVAAAGQHVQLARWLDIFRLRGEIDVAGTTALAAKAGMVALGLITKQRADQIFAAGVELQ